MLLSYILILAMLLCIIGGITVSAESGENAPVPEYKSLEELKGKRIGMQVGTVFD